MMDGLKRLTSERIDFNTSAAALQIFRIRAFGVFAQVVQQNQEHFAQGVPPTMPQDFSLWVYSGFEQPSQPFSGSLPPKSSLPFAVIAIVFTPDGDGMLVAQVGGFQHFQEFGIDDFIVGNQDHR